MNAKIRSIFTNYHEESAAVYIETGSLCTKKSSLLVGFGVAVAAAPVVSVLLLGDVVHEVNVGHDADDHLPGLDILLCCV